MIFMKCFPNSTGSRALQVIVNNNKNRQSHKVAPVLSSRQLSSAAGEVSGFNVFNVQDEEDFKKRVLEASSDAPVIVDFYAT